jgi:multidrug efflux pump subunit AcrB
MAQAIAVAVEPVVIFLSHWDFPLLIMTAIPLGIAGGIVGLALMNLVGSMGLRR